MPSGGLPKEPLHKIPGGPVQPTLLPEGPDLQLQWEMPTFTVDLSGRRVYPEWSFFSAVLHRRGTLGTFLKGTHCGRCPSSPFWMFGSPPAPWQISLPQDWVHIPCPSGLSRTYVLLPSALTLQCGGTSCVILPTGGEFQDPTGGTHSGRTPNPLVSPTPKQRFPPPWPSLEPPSFSEHSFHIVVPKGSSN